MARPEWHTHEIYRDCSEFDSDCDCLNCLAGLPCTQNIAPVEMTGETIYREDYQEAWQRDVEAEVERLLGEQDYPF